jgi:hypothetical protein
MLGAASASLALIVACVAALAVSGMGGEGS